MKKTALLSPYLNFNGTCRQAMEFYQKIMGGKLEMITFADAHMENAPADQIMHASLNNDTLSFMASDAGMMGEVVFGTSVHISIAGTDAERITKIFNGLSEGATVTMPLNKAQWGDTFGMLTDKFGIHWMVNISGEKSE